MLQFQKESKYRIFCERLFILNDKYRIFSKHNEINVKQNFKKKKKIENIVYYQYDQYYSKIQLYIILKAYFFFSIVNTSEYKRYKFQKNQKYRIFCERLFILNDKYRIF